RAGVAGEVGRGTHPIRPPSAIASSASHAPATPTPEPSTNHRHTGSLRQPHTVGASPPTATRLSPTASSGWTRVNPRLSTTTAAAVTAATNAATVRPIAHGVESSVTAASLVCQSGPFIEGKGCGGGDVERVGAPRHRNPHPHIAGPHRVFGQARPLRADEESHHVAGSLRRRLGQGVRRRIGCQRKQPKTVVPQYVQ